MGAEVSANSEDRVLPKGVYATSWGNRYWAEVQRGGTRHYLGTFATPEEASTARDEALSLLGST